MGINSERAFTQTLRIVRAVSANQAFTPTRRRILQILYMSTL